MYDRNYHILSKNYVQYLIPALLVSVGSTLQQFVDTIIVSNLLGSYAIAVENYAGPLTQYSSFATYLVGVGGAVVFARYVGSMERDKAEKTFRVCMLGGLGMGLLLSVPGFIFIDELAAFLGAEGDLLELLKDYLVPTLVLVPITILVMTFGSLLNPMGFPRITSTVLLSANVINICLDIVYIKYLHTDVDGAQWATVSGYVIAVIGLVIYLKIKKISLPSLIIKREDFHYLGESVKSGVTPSLSQLGLIVYYAYFNNLVTNLGGSSAMTIFSLCLQVLSVFSIGSQGICSSFRTFLGVLHSDEDYAGIRSILKTVTILMAVWGILVFLFVQIRPEAFMDLYNIEDERDLGARALRMYSWLVLFKGLVLVGRDFYNVTKRSKVSMTITLIEGSVGVIVLGTILSYFLGLDGIWIAFPINALIMLIAVVIRMIRDTLLWKKEPQNAVVSTCTLPMEDLDIERMNETVEEYARSLSLDRKTTDRLVLIIEETYIYTKKKAERIEYMDVVIRRTDSKAIMLLRSLGKAFNVSESAQDEEDEKYTLAILQKIPDSVGYEYEIGMNTVKLEFIFDRKLPV